jgi:4-hydroxybenzoate polyprenyltransferase
VTGQVSDAPKGNFVDRYAPAATRPYLRLMRADRPIGTWLLLVPCWWSAALAAGAAGRAWPDPWHLLLFAVGAFVMRGAGCVWNDVTDRDIDAKVARTRSRPIPSGQVSVKAALAFMVALALIGFLVLIQFNLFTILTGVLSLAVVACYPFMKRVTHFPQIVLGLAFNWGALLGWTAIFGELSAAAIALYLAGILWTLGYDTVYALQDVEDDALVGVKSTARFFGENSYAAVCVFYALALAATGGALWLAGAGAVAYLGLMAFAALTARLVANLDPADPLSALKAFRRNRDAGLALFVGLVADAFSRNGGFG